MTAGTNSGRGARRSWTALGVRMGFTSQRPQRQEILAALARMTWTNAPTRLSDLGGPAVRAVVVALSHHRRNQLRAVGVAQLAGGRQLIGLQDGAGTRRYVLDVPEAGEAIYVLAELPHPLLRHWVV